MRRRESPKAPASLTRQRRANVKVGVPVFRAPLPRSSRLGSAACLWVATALAVLLAPSSGWACGCGCGIFDVSTHELFPTRPGGIAYLEYDDVDQNRNWSGDSAAPAADNGDKEIRTHFYTVGLQYMFDRDWGIVAEVPYWRRSFTTTDANGALARFTNANLGDVRIKGIYAGFSPDMSSGITLGLKLPTGDYTHPGFDRDTQIGTGSTDVLIGGYLMGMFAPNSAFDWFLSSQLQQAVLTKGGYRPGSELDATAGISHDGWRLGSLTVAPVAQAILAHHWQDNGAAAATADSGYDRVLLAPGLEFEMAGVMLYAEVALPVFEHVNGDQLVAPALFTLRLAHRF